ncbi:hypothetical protein [Bosea sp. AAP35]|uniref:hypothetical protein n=1 Tax=Bosea sp. AAP35 TaxID=1523417 RepID=UPI0012E165D7|nr:hypothetical protein [Bosea sp. AAP35]
MMTLASGAQILRSERRRPLNAAAFLRVATPEDYVAVTTTPIRKPNLLAALVNSRLKSGRDPLILSERARPSRPCFDSLKGRVTVTYLTEAAHYLTQGHGLAHVGSSPSPPINTSGATICSKD